MALKSQKSTMTQHEALPVGYDKLDPATWTPRQRRVRGWMITIALWVLMMISWADKAILGIVAVPLMRDLNITPEQFGLLGSAVFLLFGVAQLLAAPIANKVSSKWILLVLCLIWSVAQVPVFVFATLPALWFSRLLLGAGEGPLAPITMHAIFKWFPTHKGATPAAVASSGVTMGIVIFAPVLAWITVQFGWIDTFIFLGIIGVIWAAIWIFIGKEGPYVSAKAEKELEGENYIPPSSGTGEALEAVDEKVSYVKIFTTPSWLLATITAFFAYWTFTVAMTWLPTYFETVRGMSTQQGGSLIAVPAIWGAISTIGLSRLTEVLSARGLPTRLSRGLVLAITAMVSGGAILAGSMIDSFGLSLAFFAIGFGSAPAIFALTYLVVAEMSTISQRGAVLQVTNAVLTAGGLLAPAIIGVILGAAGSHVAGFQQSFWLTGVLMVVFGIASALFINQQRDRRKLGLDKVVVHSN